MADLPAHPDTGTGPEAGPDSASPPGSRRTRPAAVGIALAIGLLALMVVLHLLGVFGPGSH